MTKPKEHPLWTAIKTLDKAKKCGAHHLMVESIEKRIQEEALKSIKKLEGIGFLIFDENGKTKNIKLRL